MRSKRVAHAHRDIAVRNRDQRARMQDFGSKPGESRRLCVRQAGYQSCIGNDARVGAQNAIDIGINGDFSAIQGCADKGCGIIRAIAPQRGNTTPGCATDKAGDNRHNAALDEWMNKPSGIDPRLLRQRVSAYDSPTCWQRIWLQVRGDNNFFAHRGGLNAKIARSSSYQQHRETLAPRAHCRCSVQR